MKRILVSFGVICILALAISAIGAEPANFAGTWVLDKSKSTGLQGRMANADVTLVVTQDGKKLVVETKVSMDGQARPSQPYAYNLDGSETSVEVQGQMPGTAKLKAKWLDGGKSAELTRTQNANIQGNDVTITTTDHWELADGGKVLKVHRVTDS